MAVTHQTLTDLYRQSRDEAYILLATVSHAELARTVRVANNTVDVVHQGETYAKCAFSVSLPNDDDDLPQARVRIQNVDREIGRSLLAMSGSPVVEIRLVSSADWDVAELTWANLKLRRVEGDVIEVRGNLYVEQFDLEPFGKRADIDHAPGLFR